MLNSLPKWVYITIGSLSFFILSCAISKCSYDQGSRRAPYCVIKLQHGKVIVDYLKKENRVSLREQNV
jgi:hypothetical protein